MKEYPKIAFTDAWSDDDLRLLAAACEQKCRWLCQIFDEYCPDCVADHRSHSMNHTEDICDLHLCGTITKPEIRRQCQAELARREEDRETRERMSKLKGASDMEHTFKSTECIIHGARFTPIDDLPLRILLSKRGVKACVQLCTPCTNFVVAQSDWFRLTEKIKQQIRQTDIKVVGGVM